MRDKVIQLVWGPHDGLELTIPEQMTVVRMPANRRHEAVAFLHNDKPWDISAQYEIIYYDEGRDGVHYFLRK